MIDRLIDRIMELKNPTVVGLDPRLGMIPDHVKEAAYAKYGKTLEGAAEAFLQFNKAIIDAVCDLVPAVKPQIAMYETLGAAGMQAFIETVRYAKEKGMIVIGDIKRSDIASTAEAYATAHIGATDVEGDTFSAFDEDMITLNPYLGSDSIQPFFKTMRAFDRGMFVLCKTSNPGGGEFQDLLVDGMPLYEKVGLRIEAWGEEFRGKYGFSDVGAVVGATYPEQGVRLRALLPHTFFLVPGYGAQGATARDLAGCFNADGIGAIVNSSRGIIGAWQSAKYKERFTPEEFALASRAAVIDMQKDLWGALHA
ncbi:MAG: orotidine-5'-phosphate decarboxylase [Clostridiales bacterium]|nr:orotidine-5'-phosphate decarboxylase [Clostridiales bacterium]